MGKWEKEGPFDKNPSFCFLHEANQQIAVSSGFFTKGEGAQAITSHLTNALNYSFRSF